MRSFVPFPAVLLAAACTSCGIADGASNSIGQASSDVPETLSAAVAAAQANADRFSSGDFAGVWERMSREVRDGITREDFVTFYETCKKTGQKIRVAGVRLDAGDAALVRMEVGGTDQSRVMLFENGNWVMKPTRLIQVTPNPSWRQTLAASAAMKPPPMIRWDGYAAPPSSLIPRKVGLARDLAQQWGSRKGIRVNAIAPGFFESK
jgi:NAD(P)-dependent dehydrogenase (short-subunit alcohol dehydrogenase family)